MSGTVEYDLTANYGLKKPWDDADDDVWGPHMNENMDLIDNLLVTRGFDASKYLPLTGGTMLGELILAADPVNPLDAATKRYVDGTIGAAVGAYLPLAGGEVTGNLRVDGALNVNGVLNALNTLNVTGLATFNNGATVTGASLVAGSNTAQFPFTINGPAGGPRSLQIMTAGVARWSFTATGTAESGANVGSDLHIVGRDDTGVAVAPNPFLRIVRATGNIVVGGSVDAGFKLDVVGTGRFSGTLTLSAGAIVSGASLQVQNTLVVGTNTLQQQLWLNGPAASTRPVTFLTASLARWQLRANSTAEGGSNAGSDLELASFTDAGAGLNSTVFRAFRSSGNITINGGVDAGFKLDVVGTARFSGQVNLNGGVAVSGATTFAGTTTAGTNTAAQALVLNGPAATSRPLRFQTASVLRWQLAANALAEGGANVGSDLDFTAYDDTGALLGNPMLRMSRATGLVTAYYGLSLGSTLAPGGVTDLSRGLALFSTTYGLNVTTNRLNFVSPLAIVAVVAGVDKFSVGAAGLTVIGNVGFNGTTPLAKPTVTGAKAGNTALASLCAALVSYGLIADTSTA